jgi:predicted O-linked N-acetylglucosamine transferase (SPINDLY family)
MLWAGVPVVTCSGRTFASRVAGSLLQAIGLPENVCGSATAYEERVMELAHNAVLRQAIRERVKQTRLTSPLFNGSNIAREIEDLYARMWERALAGLPPEHLPALQVS